MSRALDEVAVPDDVRAVRAVVGDAPTAVLLVDLTTMQVVHHNPVAQQLAPDVVIPVGLDAWADGAALRDLHGQELSETDHPLSRVARSEPVTGQAVTAAHRSALGGARTGLWVVALPMAGAPMLGEHALVVLIPLRDAEAREAAVAAAGEIAALRDRAVLATTMSFTVADAVAPGQPLVWVNPAFTATTGYPLEEVVGRNCRFLQGPATDPAAPAVLRAAIDAGEAVSTTLLNYRRDGSAFWNQVDVSPVHDATGTLTHFVGIQTDVTARVDADRARAAALESERAARADAEAARSRLTFLVEAVNRLSGSLEVDDCVGRLLELAVPDLADWALVLSVDDRQRLVSCTGRHRDPDRQAEVDDYTVAFPAAMRPGGVVDLLMAGQSVRLIEHLDEPSSLTERAGYLADLTLTERSARLGARSAMCVALPGRHGVHDVLALVRDGSRPEFDVDDVDTGLDLGSRVGLILDNARLYGAQQRIAETLQRSLLSEVPEVDGVEIAAHYEVGAREAQVGGDFYEVMPLPDGSVGVAIGDVVGHDVVAAAAMGHLKGALRALAYTAHYQERGPAALLDRLDRLLVSLDSTTIASVVYARLTRAGSGWTLSWGNAGHPAPVLRRPDGTVELLGGDEAGDLLLGVAASERTEWTRHVAGGSTLVFYTDGLVERRDAGIDDGIDTVVATVSRAPRGAQGVCDALMATSVPGSTEDDVAVLVVHLP